MISITVDDLAANGLPGQADPRVCWARSVETRTARKDEIAGLAVISDERIEAFIVIVLGIFPRGLGVAVLWPQIPALLA